MRGPSRDEPEYARAEDTFLLEDGIAGLSGRAALEIGSGSGYHSRALERSFELVVATDINLAALRTQTFRAQNRVCCDGASAIRGGFDLVICNMPYVPSGPVEVYATDGGRGGVEVPLRIMRSAIPRVARGGRFLFVTSSLSRPGELAALAASMGMSTRTISSRKMFFESLLLMEASRA